MKLSTSTLLALAMLSIAAACQGEDPAGDGSSSGAASTTGETSMGTTVASPATSGGSADESGTGAPPPSSACQAEQAIPPAPVDCAGADGILDGSAIIEDGGDDPSVLDGIVTVTGSIQVNRTALTDLNFMACVQNVAGEVTIFGNDQLTNIDGLWSLASVGAFVFSENGALTNFDGVPNLELITSDPGVFGASGNLVIKNNDALTEVTGFHSLVGIQGNLTIQTNPVLTHIDGFGGLSAVGGTLAITNNPMLCISSVDCVGEGITMPAVPPDDWSTQANDNGC